MKKFLLLLLLFILPVSFFNIAHAENGKPTNDFQTTVKQINQLGDDLIARYTPQNELDTIDGVSKLYFDYYEGSGMELAVAAISPSLNVKTESLFTQLIGAASKGLDKSNLEDTWLKLKFQLNIDLDLLKNKSTHHFTGAFLQSFSILLREGFEALLIVTALLTYLRRSAHQDKEKYIHYGVGVAVVASIITAYLFSTFLKHLGSQREAVEGLTMLFAAAVMFYVSYWLFAKSEAAKWQSFIKSKVQNAISASSLFTLSLAAFLAVYREGAETILFYQALIIGNPGQMTGMLSGFAVACLALIFLYKAMQTASFKIPFRFFFTATAIFLYYMAFTFIGNGILELQQAGWIAITPINHFPQLTWLGIFPAWQNIGAQLLFLIPTLALFVLYKNDKHQQKTQ